MPSSAICLKRQAERRTQDQLADLLAAGAET